MRLKKLGPRGTMSVVSSKGRSSRQPSTNGTCVFYQDRNNYVVFRLAGRARGFAGNRWAVLLYRSSSNRFSVRIKDAKGTVLATVTSSSGAAALATAVNANATLGPIVEMRVIGTIGATTDFSESLTDYCKFTGGS